MSTSHLRMFETDYQYTDRRTKAKYVWLKYHRILTGRILDVGADACYLKEHLGPGIDYCGIGLGDQVDQVVDLEKHDLPFPDKSFSSVICLDVLEHVDNIHSVFDEVCRVSERYVIVSLPNAWLDFYNMLRRGEYRPGQPMKFYGLPVEPPPDRHKWFFSPEEAERFVRYRAEKNDMRILQEDYEGSANEGSDWKGVLRTWARRVLVRPDLPVKNLYAGTLWVVLERNQYASG